MASSVEYVPAKATTVPLPLAIYTDRRRLQCAERHTIGTRKTTVQIGGRCRSTMAASKFHSTTTFKAVVVLAIAALLLASTGDQSSPLASRAISPPDRRSVFGFSIQRRTLWVLMMHACMQATQQRQRGRRTMASTRRRRAPRALVKERPAATGAATSATLREATPTTSAAAVLDYDLRKLRPETNLASE